MKSLQHTFTSSKIPRRRKPPLKLLRDRCLSVVLDFVYSGSMMFEAFQGEYINPLCAPSCFNGRERVVRDCGIHRAPLSRDVHPGPRVFGKLRESGYQQVWAAHCVFVKDIGGDRQIMDGVSFLHSVHAMFVINLLIEDLGQMLSVASRGLGDLSLVWCRRNGRATRRLVHVAEKVPP